MYLVIQKTHMGLLVFAAFEQNHVLESLFHIPMGNEQ